MSWSREWLCHSRRICIYFRALGCASCIYSFYLFAHHDPNSHGPPAARCHSCCGTSYIQSWHRDRALPIVLVDTYSFYIVWSEHVVLNFRARTVSEGGWDRDLESGCVRAWVHATSFVCHSACRFLLFYSSASASGIRRVPVLKRPP